MGKKMLVSALLAALALVFQILLPLASGKLVVAQPLIALVVVLAIRLDKVGGILVGALLGALSDSMQLSPIGFHGISMTLIGYVLSAVGSGVVIRSVNPVVLFAMGAYFADVGIVALLNVLLAQPLAQTLLWWWVLPGCLFTGVLAIGLELVAQKLLPGDWRGRYP